MTDTPGVGRVETRFTRVLEDGLTLECGGRLGPITVAWEQYGTPNRDRTNVVLVCHALSGGAQAAGWHDEGGKPGWWDAFIGPGRAFDTTDFCVISTNVLGGCYGTTGPASIDPATGLPHGPGFPAITVWDMVRVQRALLERLGIASLAAVAGGSMGGMQALAWSVLFPDWVKSVVAIASTDRHSPHQIAFNEVARRAVTADPAWRGGRYEPGKGPESGLAVARMLGHITYLSDVGMEKKFGRRIAGRPGQRLGQPEFEVERYLDHQGASFVKRFDANSLLYLTKAVDYFDLAQRDGSLAAALARSRARFLLLTFSSDWLYPPAQFERLARTLDEVGREVTYRCLASDCGHDAFLLDHEQQAPLVRRFLAPALLLDGEDALHSHREVAGERADERVFAARGGCHEGHVGRFARPHEPGAGQQFVLHRREDEFGVTGG
jgi:homoserine O-acetyltransferase/O-succinyltransferase